MLADNQSNSSSLLSLEDKRSQELSISYNTYNVQEGLDDIKVSITGFEVLPSNLIFYSSHQLKQFLIQAVKNSELVNVKKIINQFKSQSKQPSLTEIIDENQNSLVHLAVQSDSYKIFLLLTDFEPSLDWFSMYNKDQLLPVHIASFKGNLQILKKMESIGVNLSAQNNLGRNAISFAAQANQVAAITWLKIQDVDYLQKDKKLSTPLHWAVFYGCENTVILFLNWMLKDNKKVEINEQDDEGMTPLHLSIISGNSKIITKLIQRGADKHIQNNEGNSPFDLLKASQSPQLEKLKLKTSWYENCRLSIINDKDYHISHHKVVEKNYSYIVMLSILYSYCSSGTLLTSYFCSNHLWVFELSLVVILINLTAYVVLVLKDPGYFQVNYDNELLLNLYSTNNPSEVCSYCILLKPKRSKHCETCQRCVKVYDHHCKWINNCIGANNQIYFMIFLVSFSVNILCFVVFNAIYIGDRSADADYLKTPKNDDDYYFLTVFIQITILIICAILSMPLSYIMYNQVINLLTDMTTYERLNASENGVRYKSYYNCKKMCFLNRSDPQYE